MSSVVSCQTHERDTYDSSNGRVIVTADIQSAVMRALKNANADYSTMVCDPALADTAQFCEHYKIPLDQSANAIVLASKRPPDIYAMFLVLASTRLDANRMGRDLMDVRKVSFASSEVTAAATGMVLGGVTPFGRPDDLPLFVDAAVLTHDWVIVGGGSRAMKIKVNPEVFQRLEGTQVVEGLTT